MKFKLFFATLSFVFLLVPIFVLAQSLIPFQQMVDIPGIKPNSDFNSYINALYVLSISIAALVAVVKIIIAGVKWMLTDIVTSKQAAKADIEGALLGLLIIAAAFLILNEVNPQLTSSRLLTERVTNITPAATGNSGGGTAPLGTGGGAATTGGTNTTGGGTITTAPATPATPPVGSTKVGFYPLGTVPGVYLPSRPAPAPVEIICTESSCDAKQTQCINSGGLILHTSPKLGVLLCSKTQTVQMRCDEFVEQTERIVNKNIVKDNYPLRNCTPQLKKCYDLTPAIQKSAWINGTVSCTTNI